MLQTISWRSYFTGIACILTVYYVVVIYLYYSNDLLKQIKRLLSGESLSTPSSSTSFTAATDPALLVAGFSDELTAYTLAAGMYCSKNELLFGLRQLLQKFVSLNQPALQTELRTLIITACRDNCAVTLDPTETDVLWNG